ncbi:MAG: hypothetical protein MZU84_02390 [Sphingobacterium sp.]|nr:hypothetical protein [Sphingobacterium sp.]
MLQKFHIKWVSADQPILIPCFSNYFGYPPGKAKKELSGSPDDDLINSFADKLFINKQLHKNPKYFKPGILLLLLITVVGVVLGISEILFTS